MAGAVVAVVVVVTGVVIIMSWGLMHDEEVPQSREFLQSFYLAAV